MQIFKKVPTFDFMGHSRLFVTISIVAVVASILAMVIIGPKYGVDFMGGTEIQVHFADRVSAADVRQALADIGFPNAEVVTIGQGDSDYLFRLQAISPISDQVAASSEKSFKSAFNDAKVSRYQLSPGGDKLSIRISKEYPIASIEKAVVDGGLTLGAAIDPLSTQKRGTEEGDAAAGGKDKEETTKRCESVTCTWPYQDMRVYEVSLKGISDHIMEGLQSKSFGKNAEKMRSEWVGPKAGKQMRDAGIWSIIYSLVFIMIYVAVRFDLRFAPGGVIALFHDVAITMGVFTVLRLEVTLAIVAALLTIIGYSINDTIVIFDRIRENLSKQKERSLSSVVNASVNQTLGRTILTNFTVQLVVTAILIIGWRTSIRDFAFALWVGTLVGTYSTVFIASPLVIWLDKTFFKKKA